MSSSQFKSSAIMAFIDKSIKCNYFLSKKRICSLFLPLLPLLFRFDEDFLLILLVGHTVVET